jgi:hypothetical protein
LSDTDGLVAEGVRLAGKVEGLASESGHMVSGWYEEVTEEVQRWEDAVWEHALFLQSGASNLSTEQQLQQLTNVVCELQIQVGKLLSCSR